MFDYNLRLNKKTTFRFSFGRLCLLALGGCGLLIMLYRLLNGLGVTNLSNEWPWGFWIYCDMILSAIGSCGFAIGILTHVLHLEKFMPLARRALLLSFFCYLLVFLILFAEIGRWDNFYWVFISFAWPSPLYEVFICLTLYFLVQGAELLEVWTARYLPRYKKWVAAVMPFFVLIACILPFGQEAALGAIYLAMPGKLSAIWYSQYLPWGCLISAFSGGLCFIVMEYYGSNRYFRVRSDVPMMSSVMTLAAAVIGVNLILKIIDLSVRGAWGLVFSGTVEANLFMLEIVIGSLVPLLIFLPKVKASRTGQVVTAGCGVFGVLLNRANFVFTGMSAHAVTEYVPSFAEWGMVLGLTALVIVAYVFSVENLPIYCNKGEHHYHIVVR